MVCINTSRPVKTELHAGDVTRRTTALYYIKRMMLDGARSRTFSLSVSDASPSARSAASSRVHPPCCSKPPKDVRGPRQMPDSRQSRARSRSRLVSECSGGAPAVSQHASAAPATAARASGGDIQVHVRQSSPAMLTDPNTPLGQMLSQHASSPTPISVPFSTDGGHLSRLGTECLVFGPGSIDVAHRPNESISARSLEQTVEIVHKVVTDRCT